jgi:hypothetical protein
MFCAISVHWVFNGAELTTEVVILNGKEQNGFCFYK